MSQLIHTYILWKKKCSKSYCNFWRKSIKKYYLYKWFINTFSYELCKLHKKLKVIIASITCIFYTLKHIIENVRAELSFSVCHQGVNYIFSLKSITMTSFSDCQKHEGIIVKTLQWDEEMKALQCLHFLLLRMA